MIKQHKSYRFHPSLLLQLYKKIYKIFANEIRNLLLETCNYSDRDLGLLYLPMDRTFLNRFSENNEIGLRT